MSPNKNAENVVIFLSNMTSNVTEAEKKLLKIVNVRLDSINLKPTSLKNVFLDMSLS